MQLAHDRSGEYLSPPPPYPPLCGSKAREMGVTDNLMTRWVSMKDGANPLLHQGTIQASFGKEQTQDDVHPEPRVYGEVMDMSGFLSWLSSDR